MRIHNFPPSLPYCECDFDRFHALYDNLTFQNLPTGIHVIVTVSMRTAHSDYKPFSERNYSI